MKNLTRFLLALALAAIGFASSASAQIAMGDFNTDNGGFKTKSPTSTIGYDFGAGGAVTQITNRSTGVTINKVTGQITTINTSLAALAAATFTVTNSVVKIGDVIEVNEQSGAVNVKTIVQVTAVAAGSFNITVYNADASTAETGTIIINYVILHGASY